MNNEDRVHALELASSLLDDLELGESPLDRLLFRAGRLARLVDDDDAAQWLAWERMDFPKSDSSLAWRYATNRVMNDPDNNHYVGACRLVPMVATLRLELSQLQLPSLSGDMLVPVTNNIMGQIGRTRNNIIKHEAVLSAVQGQLHSFVVRTYYALRLSTRQDSMFETAKVQIDARLSDLGEDALRKIDAAYVNLNANDAESVSAAMNSVRRLIDGFADAVFPATDSVRSDGQGNEIKLGPQNRLNRIKAFTDDNCSESVSRALRLKRSISGIYDRVSTGVHSDVTASEARFLFLSSYTLLGEILDLSQRDSEPHTEIAVD